MGMPVNEFGSPVRVTGSVAAKNGQGTLLGIFVASASATPTIKVWNSLSASGAVIVNTFTPIAGTFYPLPFSFDVGCFIEIGGTVDATASVI